MASRNFAWLANAGGAWSLASNWNDVTDGLDPSLLVPGPADIVQITGEADGLVGTLTGGGMAAQAVFAANVGLAGDYAIGTAAMGQGFAGGLLDIGPGGTLAVAALNEISGSLLANGAGAALTAVSAVLGQGQSGLGAAPVNLYATGGGRIVLGTVTLDAGSAALYADAASSIEIGTVGGGQLGQLTIDAGAQLSGAGDANGYGTVTNNGRITASGGTLLVGALLGAGQLAIGAGAELVLNGAAAAGQAVSFSGAAGTLAFATEFDVPRGTIGGFAAGNAIDVLGSPISAATYAAGAAGSGVLTLWYGNEIADTLTLSGAYGGDVFLTASDGAGGTLVEVTPQSGGGGTAPSGTASPDAYAWIAAGGGAWAASANWQDVTAGQTPARVAPGQHDLVTIAAPQSGPFAVIAGPANAAALTVTGELGLSGLFGIGTLTLGAAGDGSGAGQQAGSLDLLPGSRITAAAAAIANGDLSVSGSSVLAVAGALALGGGPVGVGLPVATLSVTAGGTVTAALLTLGGGSGDAVVTDPTGAVVIGGGAALAGAVSVAQGASLSGFGAVNSFGALDDAGTITASGGTLTLGAVSGTGVLAIAADAALVLEAGTGTAIDFAGANATLGLADELVPLTGTLSGFAPGDAIDIENDPITAVTATRGSNTTTLALYYGSTVVSHVTLAGTFATSRWVVLPDGSGGTLIEVVPASSGGGGGGQGNTDLLAWASPGTSGAWQRSANWMDVTTGAAALAPPGSANSVALIGTTGAFETIGGPGVCASLACFGDVLLQNAFTAGTLSVGGTLNGSATAAILDIAPSSGATAATAVADGGTILVGGGASTLSVSGTLTLGVSADGTLQASGGAAAQLGGLALAGPGGSSVAADAASSVEIGTLGGAAAGAVTVDAGCTLTGAGGVNTGAAVIDNGIILASGGTLALGATSGTGTVVIGTEASLALLASCSAEITLQGAGATLWLEGAGAAPSGTIAGFAAGDAIIDAEVALTGAVFTPGAGSIGTLTLYDGTALAGTLSLAGDFSGESFTVTPDGAGSEIALQAAGSGPSQGTPTPDDYLWTGNAGTLWNEAANWRDVTAGQSPAAIAPGAQDLVTIMGGSSAFTTIAGPADAAALTVQARVALGGAYGIGALDVAAGGTLALGASAAVAAASAEVTGLLLDDAARLAVQQTLTLAGGVLLAEGGGTVDAVSLTLALPGSAVTTDGQSSIEIGGLGGAQAGAVVVDAGGVVSGLGGINPAGLVIDNGVIAAGAAGAAPGALTLGAVSGSGTLVVGVGDTLVLGGAAGPGLMVDFAGPGTLTAAAAPQASIAGFGDGDAIILPYADAAGVSYAQTGADTGILTLSAAGGGVLATLTLLGVGAGQSFAVSTGGGAAVLTTTTTPYGEGGGGSMGTNPPTQGSGKLGFVTNFTWWQSLPEPVQQALVSFQANSGGETWVWTSPSGSGFGPNNPADANVAVVANPVAGTRVLLPAGFNALLAQGAAAVWLADHAGHAVLLGNGGNDTIATNADADTLCGGSGNSEIVSTDTGAIGTVIYGGGNDSIWTGGASAVVTTAANHASQVVVGAAPTGDTITAQGRDTIVCAAGAGSRDTITLAGSDTVYAPSTGQAVIYGGTGQDRVVVGGAVAGAGGTVQFIGGTGDGGVFWCGNAAFAEYVGGAGSETIDGGSGLLSVIGGAGIMTVFGGSGLAHIQGSAGADQFVLGTGNATVTAAGGNHVWLAGAANDSLIAAGSGATLYAAGSGGADTFVGALGGLGTAAIWAGLGSDVFSFTSGMAGGVYVVNDFNTQADRILLHGYTGFIDATTGNTTTIGLADGTQIQLVGITSLSGVQISLA